MSFRLRVLALVALVAVTATATTAWLTLRQASQQITDSAEAQRGDVDLITGELTEYGRTQGTWEGVAPVVAELGLRTGQRIQLATEYGEVVVDTDTIDGRDAREVDSPPISINPRPTLELPAGQTRQELAAAGFAWPNLIVIAQDELGIYRTEVQFAACLTRLGIPVTAIEGPYGVPRLDADPASAGYPEDATEQCEAEAGNGRPRPADVAAIEECAEVAPASPLSADPDLEAEPGAGSNPGSGAATELGPFTACLSQAFSNRIEEFAPVPLNVYLGAVDDPDAVPLATAPALIAAGLVAALAVAGSLLLSRRVLRPIRALTTAARRFGDGELHERVPVAGRDELAGLARSFNRMADSLQRGEERQRRLVADVAHELRTPLANLRGYLEALKDGVVSPDPELFASLHEESVLQQRIVDDLQDLALAEAGSLVYHRCWVDLGELLETCCASHQAVAEAAQVRLDAATTGPVQVYADPDRLRQVLGNLVSNAVRASTEEVAGGLGVGQPGPAAAGSVTLTGQRAGAWVVVTVADTGTGIAPEHLPHVFDRFWRADAARGRATGGSGLGLAIARQIVTDHGGTIAVSSELGAGTTFTIRLPAALV